MKKKVKYSGDKIQYKVEFWTKSGMVPLARSLKKDGIEYTYEENAKTGVCTLSWEQ
jgi:hypothetical protein